MSSKDIPSLVMVMTPFPAHVDSQMTVKEAKNVMERKGVRHLIVMRNGEFESIVSERDLEHAGSVYGAENEFEIVLADICPAKVVIADIHDPLDVVLEAMARSHLGSVVALKEGEPVGIFTTTDACHYFSVLLRKLGKDIPDIVA
jgi:CBS domain-containing protein